MASSVEVTNVSDSERMWTAGSDDEHRWGYHVQVKDPDGLGVGAEIWFDGKPLLHVTNYSIDVGLNRASKVTVTFNAQSVNREPLA